MTPAQKFRIITWNCNHGSWQNRCNLLKKFRPDIIILQEITDPKRENDDHFVWVPSRRTVEKGVAVISSDDLKMSFYPVSKDLPEIFMPIRVTGKVAFNLLAVWTLDEKNYAGSFGPVLTEYHDFLTSPSIIAGDFNSSPKVRVKNKDFDHPWLEGVLDQKLGLVSAYHTHNQIQPGKETPDRSTFFMYGHRDRAFHLDYCFVPKNWTIDDAKIGSYDEWCNKEKIGTEQWSDHCPLIVDLLVNKKEIPEKELKS